AEQFADGMAELMGVPLRVIRGGLSGVTDGHALHIGLPQEVKHDAQTLRAYADESNVDFVAGRNVSGTAQHSTRNDGETNRGRRTLSYEFAPRNRAIKPSLHDSSLLFLLER